MPRIIEEVAVKIGADTRGLNKGLKQSKKQVSGLTSMFKKLGVTIAGVFGARVMFRSFQQTLRNTNELIKTAKGVGFLASEYQKLTFSLEQVGVNAGSAKIALGDFQKRLSKAVAGTSPQFKKAFEDAGLDVKSLSAMSPSAAFSAALAHLATLRGDPRLAGLTGNVFEEQSGKDILQVIRQWGRYLEAREKFSRRVGKLTEDQELRIEFLSEEIGVYKEQWEVLKQTIVADAVPPILRALEQLQELGVFESLGDGLGSFVSRMEEGAKQLEKDLQKIKGLIQSVMPGVYHTPKGDVSPQQMAEHLAGSESARFWNRVTSVKTDTPAMSAQRAAARQESRMSFDVSVTGDTANNKKLAKDIARAAEQRMRAQ